MPKTLWRAAGFRNLWFSHSVSLVGTQVSVLAFPLMALLLLDASPAEVSMLSAVEFLPALLLGLPAGAWVERLPRKPVLIVSDVVRALAMATIPVAHWLGMLNMPLLFVVAFIIGLGTVFFEVAQLSYLPALIKQEELADGNATLEGSRAVAQLAGPSAGGFLVQLFSAPVAIAVDVVTYVLSIVFLLRVRGHDAPPELIENPQPIERMTLRGEIAEGVRFVFSHPLVRPLALCALAADLAFAAVLALQVPFASETLDMKSGAIGIALAVGSAGGLAGAALSSMAAKRFGSGPTVLVSVVVFSIGAAMVPPASGPIGFGAGLFVVYLGVVVFNILQVTICQVATPARLLGRMNATLRFISWGSVPLGAAVAGVLVAPFGMRAVLWGAAGVCALSVLPPLFSKVRTLTDDLGDDEGAPVSAAAETERVA